MKKTNVMGIDIMEAPLAKDQALLISDSKDSAKQVLIKNIGTEEVKVSASGNTITVDGDDRSQKDSQYLRLIMLLVTGARNNKELYRTTRKEIKRLMLEDKDARDFFKKAFNSIKV